MNAHHHGICAMHLELEALHRTNDGWQKPGKKTLQDVSTTWKCFPTPSPAGKLLHWPPGHPLHPLVQNQLIDSPLTNHHQPKYSQIRMWLTQ